MSWEQRNADFCKAQLDAEFVYIEAERRVKALEDENAKLRELVRFANKTVEGLCGLVENSPGCSMCPLNQDEDRACGAAELFSRMHELGVEL